MGRNLTIKAVADLLGASTRTVYRLIADGELTAFKLRGALFPFSLSQLWALVKRGEFPAPVKLSERCSAWSISNMKARAEKLRS